MHRQLHYIIYAALLLAAGAGSILLISSIDPVIIPASQPGYCGTPDPAGYDLSKPQSEGKSLFMKWCASCHIIGKDATGPDLLRFEERGPWKDRRKLYEWIREPEKFIRKDAYARKLYQTYNGTRMMGFPDLTDEEIDALAAYLNGS